MTTNHYRCEHCGTVYDHELLTRVHITRSDDDAHQNHNGCMPECTIEVIDDSGTLLERRSRRPEEIDPTTLTRDDLPDDLSPKRTEAVFFAAHHPETAAHADLTQLIEDALADTDRDPPSKRTVSRALAAFYRPHEDEGPRSRPFAAVSPLQQAIIVASLANPAASAADIARWVDCSESYPPMVMSRRADIVESLKQRLEDGESLATILTDTLTPTQQHQLTESGHFDDVPVKLEVAAAGDTAAADATSATDATTGTLSDDWGSPTADNRVMSATPEQAASTKTDGGNTAVQDAAAEAGDTPAATETADPTEAATPTVTDSNTDAVTATTQSPAATLEGEPETALAAIQQLEQLADNLHFFAASMKQKSDQPSAEREMLIGLAENTEETCTQIIQEVTANANARRE